MENSKSIRVFITSIIVLFSSIVPIQAHAGNVSGVDAFIASVKFGCLEIVSKTTTVEDFVGRLKGGQMPDASAALFLAGHEGKAYGLPHPDHQLVLTVFDGGKTCSIFVRRIDKVSAEAKLNIALQQLGFTILHPREERKGLYTTGYEKAINGKAIGVVTSFSVENEGNFDAVATVHVPPKS